MVAELNQATWGEVYEACCVHTVREWLLVLFGIFLTFFFLYWFLFALNVMGTSAKVLSGCHAGGLFTNGSNPVSAVMLGVIATVLLDSSSTTTSIIISLTGTVISKEDAIYMVMGCNVGTVSQDCIAMADVTLRSIRLLIYSSIY
jgi:solute carrier family 34 (sodium-dependent phosphate cotransporter)